MRKQSDLPQPPDVPAKTILEIPTQTQAQMLAESAPYPLWLLLHMLLCASGRSPTEIAEFFCCSRSGVYRTMEAYRKGMFQPAGADAATSVPSVPA